MTTDLSMTNEEPSFSVVEVEVNSRCNRRCGYCPVSTLPTPQVPTFMDREVFVTLLVQLSLVSFAGRLSYHFYNEPLLRRDLEDFVAQARAALPLAHQVLYTNGDFLSPQRHSALKEAGIDRFIVTRHDNSEFPAYDDVLVLTPDQLVLTNRGGAVPHIASRNSKCDALPCWAPTEMLIVTAIGDVLLCYEDAQRRHIQGNIMRNTLSEIWNNEHFAVLRARLASGERASAAGICLRCNNSAHTKPGNSWFAL